MMLLVICAPNSLQLMGSLETKSDVIHYLSNGNRSEKPDVSINNYLVTSIPKSWHEV